MCNAAVCNTKGLSGGCDYQFWVGLLLWNLDQSFRIMRSFKRWKVWQEESCPILYIKMVKKTKTKTNLQSKHSLLIWPRAMCYLAMHTGSSIMLVGFFKSSLGLWLMLFINLVTVWILILFENNTVRTSIFISETFPPTFWAYMLSKRWCIMLYIIHIPVQFDPQAYIYISPSIYVYSWQLPSHSDLHHSLNITVPLTISFKNRYIY